MKLINADAMLQHIDYEIEKLGMSHRSDFVSGMKTVRMMVENAAEVSDEITNEQAIDHLLKAGWLQEHDKAMSEGDVAALINRIMEAGDKSISVNIYPVKEDIDDE